MIAGRLVGMLYDVETRHSPKPAKPERPLTCPRCAAIDIHGDRPCRLAKALEDDPRRRTHDWHCHACGHSWHVGDETPW